MAKFPATILIDTGEQHPWSFTGMLADASHDYANLFIPTKRQALGAYQGDYSLEGFEGQCNIERKSCVDCQATLLGWSNEKRDVGRRDRFEKELASLAGMNYRAVIVECSFAELIASAPEWGKKPKEVNQKILHRTVMAMQLDYAVPWFFCDSRRMAEITAVRIFQRFLRKVAKKGIRK